MPIGIIVRNKNERSRPSFYDTRNAGEVLKIGREINRATSMGLRGEVLKKEFGADANRIVCPQKHLGSDETSRKLATEAVKQIREIVK